MIGFRVGEDGSWDEMEEIETPTNDTTYTIQNLIPFTVYSFRIAAVNAMGRSQPSKESYYMVTLREGEYHYKSYTYPIQKKKKKTLPKISSRERKIISQLNYKMREKIYFLFY